MSRRAVSASARAAALALALALAVGPGARAADEPQATARLTPDPVGLGELAALEIKLASPGFDSPSIEPLFELENLEVVAGPFQAQSHSWVNGRTSSSFQLIWRLRPLAAGPARVTALRLRVDGREIALPDQEVAAVEEAPPGRVGGAPGAAADPFEDLFDPSRFQRRRAAAQRPKVQVRAEVVPADPFVGQQVAYRLVLFTQTDISAFNPRGLPDFRGLWAREVELPERSRPEWVELDGERFGRVVMLQRALYPLSAGKFTLGPIDVDVVLRVSEAGFFGPFGRNLPQSLRTNPITIEARPLPGAPPGFTGVVGDLAVEARLDRSATDVGQAATYTLEVESRGHLQGLVAPELGLPPGLTAYPPRPETKERVAGGALVAHQTWRYVLVPDRAGDFTLPAVELVYYDPAARTFRTAASKPLALAVRGASAPAPSAPVPEAPRAPARTAPSWPLWAGGGLVVVTLLGLGYALGRRSGRPPGVDPARRLLAALESAVGGAPREAAEGCERAWRGFLATRFALPPDAPPAELEPRLRAAGLGPEPLAALAALFEEIDYLRHAPELSDLSHVGQEIVDRSRRLLRDLG